MTEATPVAPPASTNPIAAAASHRPEVPLPKRVIETLQRMVTASDRDVPWEDVLGFYQLFDKPFTEETEAQFKKKYNPDGHANIKWEPAKFALTEIFKSPELLPMLQVDVKCLDIHNHQTVHHGQDFRYMLEQLGEPIEQSLMDDFIREALGKQDDTFDLKQYLELMCNH